MDGSAFSFVNLLFIITDFWIKSRLLCNFFWKKDIAKNIKVAQHYLLTFDFGYLLFVFTTVFLLHNGV